MICEYEKFNEDLLPNSFDATIFWSEEELEWIKGTNLFGIEIDLIDGFDLNSFLIINEYELMMSFDYELFEKIEGTRQVNFLLEYVHSILKEVDSTITLDEVKWVHTVFSSRSFGIKTKSSEYSTSSNKLR
jgi:hypothetical protein